MDEASGIFSVTDYKSGKSASSKDIKEGMSLQLPLYLRIAEDLLRANGVEVVNLDSAECKEMMRIFIAEEPELWNEDIGV